MMVSFNYSEKLLKAYKAGASAMLIHLKMDGPKPDAEKWLEKQASKPLVVRG